ncbi:MAG: type II secretion system protein N [Hyphomonas sp.]
MMRFILFLILLIGFILGLAAFAPLGLVLKLSGAEARGINWTSAQGTLSGGEITGLRAGPDKIGDARVRLKPAALLAGRLEYDFDWAGPAGTGSGRAAASATGATELRDFAFDLAVSEFGAFPIWLRRSGGRAQLNGDIIRLRNGECEEARGTTWSDALERNESLLGPGWTDFTGALSCDGGALLIPFASTNGNGTRLDAAARIGSATTATLEARISGYVSEQARYALPMAGFAPDGGAFVYRYPGSQADLAQ